MCPKWGGGAKSKPSLVRVQLEAVIPPNLLETEYSHESVATDIPNTPHARRGWQVLVPIHWIGPFGAYDFVGGSYVPFHSPGSDCPPRFLTVAVTSKSLPPGAHQGPERFKLPGTRCP